MTLNRFRFWGLAALAFAAGSLFTVEKIDSTFMDPTDYSPMK